MLRLDFFLSSNEKLAFPKCQSEAHIAAFAGFLNSVGLLWDAKDQKWYRNLFKLSFPSDLSRPSHLYRIDRVIKLQLIGVWGSQCFVSFISPLKSHLD